MTVQKFANDGSFESIERQLCKLAHTFMPRVEALGLSMTIEDVKSELALAYVKARSKWKPEGVTVDGKVKVARFSTYFQTAACRHFNNKVSKEELERVNLGMFSYHAMSDEAGEGDADGALSFMEQGSDVEDSPEAGRERIEALKANLTSLSPDARTLITALLADQRIKSKEPAVDLRTLCRTLQIKGDRLKSVKAEMLARFDVTWP